MYYVPGPTMNWVTSFYAPAPGVAPVGATSVAWRTSTIQTTLIDVLGYAFQTGKNELLPFHTTSIDANPNLVQNKNY
jgi:starch-binding outer membrane protein, SusD/RagB family